MRLEGERILLRKLKKSDVDSLFENAKDFEIAKFTTLPYPYLRKHAVEFIPKTHERFRQKSGFDFGIELKSEKKIVGMISLSKVDYDNKKAELGYWLGKNYWGNGLVSEAVPLILNFGFEELKLCRIFARVCHTNKASSRILEKFGLKYEGCLIKDEFRYGEWSDTLLYALVK